MGIIDYNSPLRVLVSVKGHPFARDAFSEMFDSFEGIAHTLVEQPATQDLLRPEVVDRWDAIVFYDMPGIDFSEQPPRLVPPPQQLKDDFQALLESGKGLVFLHHAIAGWPLWPEYGDVIGGRFFYLPAQCRGQQVLDSGYRHDVNHRATVLDESHPVTAGVEQEFDLNDELYHYRVFDREVTPLLRSDYEFERDNFYSATKAVTGTMYSNEGWYPPTGSSLLGWSRRCVNSPVVYLQPGDGPATFANESYRRLVNNAIHWVAGAHDS